jgi:hypothetical protein
MYATLSLPMLACVFTWNSFERLGILRSMLVRVRFEMLAMDETQATIHVLTMHILPVSSNAANANVQHTYLSRS